MRNWLNGAMRPAPAFAMAGESNFAPERKNPLQRYLAGTNASRTGARGGASSREMQAEKSAISRRAVLALALLVLFPPASIMLMWRRNIFALRGRVLLSVVGVILMAVAFGFLIPEQSVEQATPMPVRASLRTPLPTDAALNALSNMEELLAGVEMQPIISTDPNDAQAGAAATPAPTEEPEDPMQTVVYAVNKGAKYYHKSGECHGQVNRRALTVAQALTEGITACGRCNPVAP